MVVALFISGVALASPASERTAQPLRDAAVVDSGGYFPHLSADGSRLLVSSIDAKELSLYDLSAGSRVVVRNSGLPGFDAMIGNDGKVYYVTMARSSKNLVFRSAFVYDPKNGKTKRLLKPQHGAVRIVQGTKGVAVVGESESYNLKKAGTVVWAQNDELCVSERGKIRTLKPVDGSVGYLWASLSPDGDKIAFNAAGKGTFVCDLNGNLISSPGKYLMPCWYDNQYLVAMNGVGNVQKMNGSRICLIDSNNGRLVKLLTDENVAAIQPSVGAGRVVYTTKNGEVRVMTIDFYYEDQ